LPSLDGLDAVLELHEPTEPGPVDPVQWHVMRFVNGRPTWETCPYCNGEGATIVCVRPPLVSIPIKLEKWRRQAERQRAKS